MAIGAFLLFLGTAAYYNIPTPEVLNTRFGWEYGNIAETLVEGKGFANTFGADSGPTAWMPPLFVLLLAGTFYFFGIKSIAAMWAIFLIKYIALAASLALLLSTAGRVGFHKYRYLLAILFLMPIYFNRDVFFRSLHDDWLNLFLACLMIHTFAIQGTDGISTINTLRLCILAVVLPFTNPALALAFAVAEGGVTLSHSLSGASLQRRWLSCFAVFGFLAASTLLWTYRNYQVFGRVIPIKSNFWFDFYQANSMDDDGLITNETFARYHPINKNDIQAKYLIEGETRFTEEYRRLSFEWIRAHPIQLLMNIGRRAASAFVHSHYVEDILPVNPDKVSLQNIERLRRDQLIFVDDSSVAFWISLSIPQSEFEDRIRDLDLSGEASILQDWSEQREHLNRRRRSWRIILKSLSLSLVPSLCILVGLILEGIRKTPLFSAAVTIYLTYLAPYILTSHYRRYQVPLIGMQSILLFLILCFILERFPFSKIPVLDRLLPGPRQ